MSGPVSETDPAEIEPARAYSTRHMVATLVLLDWPGTLRAALSVGLNPSKILRLSARFLIPQRHDIAVAGGVALMPARQASLIATLAHDSGLDRVLLELECKLTSFLGAPAEVAVRLTEGLA